MASQENPFVFGEVIDDAISSTELTNSTDLSGI
jgi:hypothetical protein